MSNQTRHRRQSLGHVFSFSFLTACYLCVSHELMDETKVGKEVAVQRRRPQVWTGVWVHCHSGMGAVPGAQLRGVAHRYTQPLGLRWNTEVPGKEEEAGWEGVRGGLGGVSASISSRIALTLRNNRSEFSIQSVRWAEIVQMRGKHRFWNCTLKSRCCVFLYMFVCFYVCRREWSMCI